MVGYTSELYASALAEFGEPVPMESAGSWLLARSLPAGGGRDAAGCYPLFSCQRWEGLGEDLERLPSDLIAVSLVADPLTLPGKCLLEECFADVCRPYKEHFVVDLTLPLGQFVSQHHQRNARQASRHVSIVRAATPSAHVEIWNTLYSQLVQRHSIRGMAAFSADSFARQMHVPGLSAYLAVAGEEVLGMVLWMVNGATAHYHLAAYSERGYELKASFALFWQCFEDLRASGVARVSLGGGAGVFQADEGLSRFKRGWSSETRPAYFCGRILDRRRYDQLVVETGTRDSAYFPAYRTPHAAAAA